MNIQEVRSEDKVKSHPNKNDLTGKKFGRLTVIRDTGKRPNRVVVYECICDCGNVKEVIGNNLSRGKSKSCGCLKGATKDLTGKIFGELTAIKELRERKSGNKVWLCRCSCGKMHKATANALIFAEVRTCGCSICPDISGYRFGRLVTIEETGYSTKGRRDWLCKCDCGKECTVNRTALNSGKTKSCGCLSREWREGFDSLMKQYRPLFSGENHYNYNYDLSDLDRVKMRYELYGNDRRIWRKEIFMRDNHTCQICYEKGGELNAHHLNGYNWHESGRYDINNGVTLCKKCHLEFHSKYGYGYNTENQFIEFESSKNNL